MEDPGSGCGELVLALALFFGRDWQMEGVRWKVMAGFGETEGFVRESIRIRNNY
jgi:hypothetical protein